MGTRSTDAYPPNINRVLEAHWMRLNAEIDPHKTYRLLQLTPQLESSLREDALTLKSGSDGAVYACTRNSTHLVRMWKQTNTLLISRCTEEADLTAFASPQNLLETVSVKGTVDWSHIREYGRNDETVESEICCSAEEFDAQCRERPATYINGTLYQIPPDTVHDVLVYLVSSMVESGDLNLQSLPDSFDLDYPKEVVMAVYNKFLNEDERLDLDKMSEFTGLYLLSKAPEGVPKHEFLKEWRLDLPVKMEIGIPLLYGHVVEHASTVNPLEAASLPSDAKLRLHKLFTIKPEWPLAEIEPFIRPLVPHTQKLDAWVLKYAKKKRVGAEIHLIPLRR